VYRRWNPCEPIDYKVNVDLATSPQIAIMNEAIAELEQATGIDMVFAGTTSESYADSVPSDFGADVFLAFSDPATSPFHFPDEGAATRIGVAYRSTMLWQDLAGDLWFEIVRGSVFIDRNVGGGDDMRGVWAHELAHVLGLYHVGDPTEVMYPYQLGVHDYGPGDLEGLWNVGAAQSCIPDPPA
jgi:hypothetical protein